MILIVSEWWQIIGMQAGTAIECPETGEVWQQARTPITLATASKMRDSCFDRCYIIIPRDLQECRKMFPPHNPERDQYGRGHETLQPDGPVLFTVEVRRV